LQQSYTSQKKRQAVAAAAEAKMRSTLPIEGTPVVASSPPAAKKHSQLYPISAKGTSVTVSAPPAAPKKRSRIIVEGTRRAKAAALAKKRNIESEAEAPPLRSRRPPQPWTPAEEQLLEELKAAGQSWNDIVKAFPTRSMESVKGHWEVRSRVSRIISTLRAVVLRILGHTLRFTMESGAEKILDTE
jgi:hypothetical protein